MVTASPPAKKQGRQKASSQAQQFVDDNIDELGRYKAVFEEISRFMDVIRESENELLEAKEQLLEAKAAYEAAKEHVNDLNDVREGAKHGLFRYLNRGEEILPLFDQMEPADEEVHGVHSTEWRAEPVTALRLSLTAQIALNEAEIILVGQLQDRVLHAPERWWEGINGLTLGVAAAIVDRLNAFISERSSK